MESNYLEAIEFFLIEGQLIFKGKLTNVVIRKWRVSDYTLDMDASKEGISQHKFQMYIYCLLQRSKPDNWNHWNRESKPKTSSKLQPNPDRFFDDLCISILHNI